MELLKPRYAKIVRRPSSSYGEGWPDDKLFTKFVTELITRAKKKVAKVRAFGELVASLWARGDQPATVRPEHLRKIFAKRRRCLFSAPTCGPALPGMHPNRSVKSALHTRSLWQTDSSPDRSSRNVTLRKPVHPHARS